LQLRGVTKYDQQKLDRHLLANSGLYNQVLSPRSQPGLATTDGKLMAV